jgi:elongator complex protein 4
MRKRFVIETLHLDVEGGVSERRTEPVGGLASVTTTNTIHSHIDPVEPNLSEHLAKVAIEGPIPAVSSPPPMNSLSAPAPASTNAENKQKKPRKKVAFQSAESILYDF